MQILLASAKIMRGDCRAPRIVPHEPMYQSEALTLADDMKRFSGFRLSELFSCSPEIGETNRRRFEIFGSDEAEILPAIFAYYGQAYKHLKADTLTMDDLEYADTHLWISSCLYGLLRPLDGINLYRMEGGFSLPCSGGLKVNDFWRPRLTDTLLSSVKADDGILVYLDTEEFRTLFEWKRVVAEVRVVEPKFRTLENGRMKTPSVWAKTCRGAMARYIIENRLTSVKELESFSYEGFAYDGTSPIDFPVFIRKGKA